MKLVLIGFATSYKTSAGKLIAEKLNCDFFDVDNLVESREQKTIAEIFALCGESGFRRAETDILSQLRQVDGVIACGGGSVLSPAFLPLLEQNAKVVWLKTSAEYVMSRLDGKSRPLFDTLSLSELRGKIDEREKIYAKFADFCVETDGKTSAAAADEIIKML